MPDPRQPGEISLPGNMGLAAWYPG
ncbi:hypothetical protein STPH1_1958 [Streptomyces sp. OM5714]|nr:hypothetical protein STPH1_1958 [Streptomyces sp. OM5714]